MIFTYARSILFIILFISTLVFFDILMRLVRPFSYQGFLKLQYMMCTTIRLLLSHVAGVTFKISVNNDLPADMPILVISNHQSMYDVSLLTELFQKYQPRFISKKEIASWIPAVSFISRNNKTALIDRKNRSQALTEINKVAAMTNEENAALVIFPEGTRARDGIMKPFKHAGTYTILAQLPKAVIIPVAINGSWKVVKNTLFPIPKDTVLSVTSLEPILWNVSSNLYEKEIILDQIEASIRKLVTD